MRDYDPTTILELFGKLAGSARRSVLSDVVQPATGKARNDFAQPWHLAWNVPGTQALFESDQQINLVAAGPQLAAVKRLQAVDALRREQRLLRIGWAWFAGIDAQGTRWCLPALSAPVRVRSLLGLGTTVQRIGDIEITDLVPDLAVRDKLLAERNYGGGALDYSETTAAILSRLPTLMAWAHDVTHALGVDVTELLTADTDLWARASQPGIAIVFGHAIYVARPPLRTARQDTLAGLAALPDLDASALAAMYAQPSDRRLEPSVDPLPEVRPLSAQQRDQLGRIASQRVSVLSGAPGTGKTHLVTALAMTAVAKGNSVLVVGGSSYAADVLIEHFDRTPGPTPVAFGSSEHGTRLAAQLLDEARRPVAGSPGSPLLWGSEIARLDQLFRAEALARSMSADPGARLATFELLERAGDRARWQPLADKAQGRLSWFARRRARRLCHRLGLPADDATLADVLGRLVSAAAARDLLGSDGLSLVAHLDALADKERDDDEIVGADIVASVSRRAGTSRERRVSAVANALSNGRGTRRHLLAGFGHDDLVRALPLWVGSARDVAEILPARAALFDLVIIDESAQLDQMTAAPALARGRAAVVCGDPAQLSMTSFLSGQDVADACESLGVDPTEIDPARMSTYDLAASRAPLHLLTEHYRSIPSLIEFPAEHFYRGSLAIATRHPTNEASSAVHLHVIPGERGGSLANPAEVEACMAILAEVVAASSSGGNAVSVGILSPFREQVDAIEQEVLASYAPEQIDALQLTVDTAHGFQGSERDVMILSWCVGAGDEDSRWRFVNQRDLFNVMVTRAKEEIHVVTSRREPPGLAGEYLRWVARPRGERPGREVSRDPWVQRVAAACRDAGLALRADYPVGSHLVDLVIGHGTRAIALECRPHPGGPEAHLDRALLLRRMGWRNADAYESRWSDRLGELAIELSNRAGSPDPGVHANR